MLTIDIDEWEWCDRFDHTMLNLLAVMLRHQSAEVERLTWMLREVYGDWVDGESYESWLADLASRWEER